MGQKKDLMPIPRWWRSWLESLGGANADNQKQDLRDR
jgi:hypothetical protein